MCGIAGLIARVDEAAVRRALDAMAHRGPDDEGVFIDPSGVVLGHRRLAVVDLSPTGRQPMSSDDGLVTIVFNGEIYDHGALRERLDRGRFRGTSDTEVLLRGYERWGIDGLLARIDGMFAFAIWDGRRSELHLARDGFGKKPLYLSKLARGFAFASTLPAILQLRGDTPEVDGAALVELLTLTYVSGGSCIAAGVEKLAPGTRLTVRADGTTDAARFFVPRLGPFETRSDADWVDAIDEALGRAVARRLVADVPVAAFLSGGLDSSLVVAKMASLGARVRTIAMGFEDESIDERPHARAVADAFGTDHTEIVLSPDALSILPELVHRSGEPLADHALLPTYLLAREAKAHATVVLTGDGGDELFGGYESYRAVALGSLASRLPVGAVASRLAAIDSTSIRRLASRLELIAAYSEKGATGYVVDPLGRRGFRHRLDELLSPAFAASLAGRDPDRDQHAAHLRGLGLGPVDRAMNVDLTTQLPDDFLVKLDVATMAHGVEARSPLLDRELFELARVIPASTKLGRGRTKHLLRLLAARTLPRAIARRPKRGFSPDTGRFLLRDGGAQAIHTLLLSRGGLDERFVRRSAVARILDEHVGGARDHGQRILALLVADVFLRLFVDRTLAPTDDLRRFAADLPR